MYKGAGAQGGWHLCTRRQGKHHTAFSFLFFPLPSYCSSCEMTLQSTRSLDLNPDPLRNLQHNHKQKTPRYEQTLRLWKIDADM